MRTNGTEIMIISIILIIKKTVAVEENLSADLSTLNVMRKKLTHA